MKIDIFADVVCPWCRIGEARLFKAMDEFSDVAFERHWRPFQLQPSMPAEGIEWNTFAEQKFGGADRAKVMFERVTQVGKRDGITFNFEKVSTAPNTVDAHRLILLAATLDKTWDMSHVLYRAYFEERADLNDHATLLTLSDEVGLPEDAVNKLLNSEQYRDEVMSSQLQAHQMGISGVPFFILNDRYGVSGAQPIEVFKQAIEAAQMS